MVYIKATKKTFGFMILAATLGLVLATFTDGGIRQPTGLAVSDVSVASGGEWILFVLGFFCGVLALGTYVYIAHFEAKRHS